jgi:D-serine dehydratase
MTMADLPLLTIDDPYIDDRIRGVPAGHEPLKLSAIGVEGWKPFDGLMQLPLISLDLAAFRSNTAAMMTYVKGKSIAIAPHAKTPMSPALAIELIASGAWGATVADIRQASVMLKAGIKTLLIANEVGGASAGKRLAAVLSHHPEAAIHVFVDSPELVQALREAWSDRPDLPRLGLLVELGAARAGLRTSADAEALADLVLGLETPSFQLTGVASYEGAAATSDAEETKLRIVALMAKTAGLYSYVRNKVGGDRPLIVTAGGSVYFDYVVRHLEPVLASDPNATLILRSGAIFFHDHGVYKRGLAALDARQGFERDGKPVSASAVFAPALRLWAEVLSRPEPGLAIVGMGLRDVAMDQGLPNPLALYRNGASIGMLSNAIVSKLNDQHAFVEINIGDDVRTGDVIEFGISHPCTCLDRHALVYGLDEDRTVQRAYPTSFG